MPLKIESQLVNKSNVNLLGKTQMFNAEQLQEKWKPLLEHDGIDNIKDNHRKAVTAVLLENQERFLR